MALGPQTNKNMQQQQPQLPPQNFPPSYPPYGQFHPYQGQGFGPQGGFPGEPGGPNAFAGYPPMSYGGSRAWYGAPGQQFPAPPQGQFASPSPQMPVAPGGLSNNHQMPVEKPTQSTPSVESALRPNSKPDMQPQSVQEPNSSQTNNSGQGLTDVQRIQQNDDESRIQGEITSSASVAAGDNRSVPNGQKTGSIFPAVPVSTQSPRTGAGTSGLNGQATTNPVRAALQYQNPTQAATAAVAAAMAKLPPMPGAKVPQGKDDNAAIDNLTRKVKEMRTNDRVRNSRQPGTGGYAAGHRGGRGGRRGHRHDSNTKPLDVPATDFDFESSNAKFNKQDLVKEAIATGSPKGNSPTTGPESAKGKSAAIDGAANAANAGNSTANTTSPSTPSKTDGTGGGDVVIPAAPATYNKAASFFDNISSELKDREEAGRLGGREFRTEERRKNMETFGQGSVDSGYRGGYHRGRGRGRGGGFRGRGGGGYGRGGRGSSSHAGRGRGYSAAAQGPVHVQQVQT